MVRTLLNIVTAVTVAALIPHCHDNFIRHPGGSVSG